MENFQDFVSGIFNLNVNSNLILTLQRIQFMLRSIYDWYFQYSNFFICHEEQKIRDFKANLKNKSKYERNSMRQEKLFLKRRTFYKFQGVSKKIYVNMQIAFDSFNFVQSERKKKVWTLPKSAAAFYFNVKSFYVS